MRNLVLLLLLMISQKSFSQTESKTDSVSYGTAVIDKDFYEDDSKIFTKAEKEPQFPGGETAWNAYLSSKLNPDVGVQHGAPAGTYKVIIRFIVKKDGSLADLTAQTGYGYGMENEVIRILKESPKWIPAMQNDFKVNFYMRQPVSFVVSVK